MKDEIQNSAKTENTMSFLDYATEVVGWLQIVASPLLVGLGIAALIYFSNPSTLRLVIAIVIVLIALIIGIAFATRVWKKHGTMNFVSRISASPEIDKLNEEKR